VVTAYGTFDTSAWNHPGDAFHCQPDLGNPQYLGGPYQVGNPAMPGYVGGFMTPIPTAYQLAFGGPFLSGQCCLNIIGRTSSGPSASVFDPDHLGAQKSDAGDPARGLSHVASAAR
jgi:hypothetical protein